MTPPARLVPDFAFPPYAFVPGRFPHPTRDPAGHSYLHAPAEPPPIVPRGFGDSRAYLVGCDLFNHGYYWEAHEEWEGLWKACGRQGAVADFLKGLIKLAAAGVKAREGRADGVARHARRARELFAGVRAATGQPRFLGLALAQLIERAEAIARQRPTATNDAPVQVVFDFTLLPEDH